MLAAPKMAGMYGLLLLIAFLVTNLLLNCLLAFFLTRQGECGQVVGADGRQQGRMSGGAGAGSGACADAGAGAGA